MANELQIDVCFKSDELITICSANTNIIVKIKVDFPADVPPTFTVIAENPDEPDLHPVIGCPYPCR